LRVGAANSPLALGSIGLSLITRFFFFPILPPAAMAAIIISWAVSSFFGSGGGDAIFLFLSFFFFIASIFCYSCSASVRGGGPLGFSAICGRTAGLTPAGRTGRAGRAPAPPLPRGFPRPLPPGAGGAGGPPAGPLLLTLGSVGPVRTGAPFVFIHSSIASQSYISFTCSRSAST